MVTSHIRCQERCRPVALVHRHTWTHDSVWDPLGWPFMFSTWHAACVFSICSRRLWVFPRLWEAPDQGWLGCPPAWGPLVTLAQTHSYRLMAAGRCPALLQSLRGYRLTLWVLLTCIHTSGRDFMTPKKALRIVLWKASGGSVGNMVVSNTEPWMDFAELRSVIWIYWMVVYLL